MLPKPLPGEMIQFDLRIFLQIGGLKPLPSLAKASRWVKNQGLLCCLGFLDLPGMGFATPCDGAFGTRIACHGMVRWDGMGGWGYQQHDLWMSIKKYIYMYIYIHIHIYIYKCTCKYLRNVYYVYFLYTHMNTAVYIYFSIHTQLQYIYI